MGVASSPGPQRSLQTRHPSRLAGRQAEPAAGGALDLVALVAAAEPGERDGDPAGLDPEDRRILDSCREPVTVAEVASATALSVSVVRVRLADLIRRGRITLQSQPPAAEQPGPGLLGEVLDGLRTL
jgi:Protein of unknown function (DUF742)